MYVVAGQPAGDACGRAGSAGRLRRRPAFWHESLCLNSGRIGGAARGSVAWGWSWQAMGLSKHVIRIELAA